MSDTYLEKAHALTTAEETRDFYDAWAETYDQEIMENGYITPMRIARALAAQTRDLNRPVLDYGCGTGLSGAALLQAGFTCVDGADLSQDMLALARDKGVYRNTWPVQPDSDFPYDPGAYASITASGVIGVGLAPPETLDLLLDQLNPGGLLAFSFNDHALAAKEFPDRLRAVVEADKAHILFQEHGDHLPKIAMNSTVYVLQRH